MIFLIFHFFIFFHSIISFSFAKKLLRQSLFTAVLPEINSQNFNLQSANSFPSNPTYAIMEMYNSAECGKDFVYGVSFLLDTCISSGSDSVWYSCGK